MSNLRTSMLLLGLCVLGILVAALRLATQPKPPLPAGSSSSAQADGTEALYLWTSSLGDTPQRLEQSASVDRSALAFVLQPLTPVDPVDRQAFDRGPAGGGTLVVAGDSTPWQRYVADLGITAETPANQMILTAHTPDGSLNLPVFSRFVLHAQGATPLLVSASGDWIGLRMPYQRGTLIVLSSSRVLSNAGLRDSNTARFVYRELLSAVPTGSLLAFDERHRGASVANEPATLNALLFGTPVGWAIIYGSVLVFVFLLLSGRRLGPPLPARSSATMRRTMYEHVQMLADLYRRAGQLHTARAAYARFYGRRLSKATDPRRAAEALAGIDAARTSGELIAAVSLADDAR